MPTKAVKKVSVVGGGISGLTAAYLLAKEGIEVVVYEKGDNVAASTNIIVNGTHVDIGFLLFNPVTYFNEVELLECLGLDMEPSDMSFSVSLSDGNGWEWGTRSGLSSLFAQKKNALNPSFWKLIREINRFNNESFNFLRDLDYNTGMDCHMTLEQFVRAYDYSELFVKSFLVPYCTSIWPGSAQVLSFSAYSVLSFFQNHHASQLFSHLQGPTPRQHSQDYVNRVKNELGLRGCQIRTNSEVHSVLTDDGGCAVTCKDGFTEVYDQCIIATSAPEALKLLEKQATYDESRILGAFQYASSNIFLHQDDNLMPKNRAAWSSWNFLDTSDNQAYVTHWLNSVKIISEKKLPLFLTSNAPHTPKYLLHKWSTSIPIPSVAASKALAEFNLIEGKRGIWFCGAYQGNAFHEGGLKRGILAANGLLGKAIAVQRSPTHMVPSWPEAAARLYVTHFFRQFIMAGSLTLVEEGGKTFTFEGTKKLNIPKVILRVNSTQFYWKVATESDIGFADAYINGDILFVDKNHGLLNLISIFTANIELATCATKLNNKRGWWTPVLFTSIIASAKYFVKNISERNSIPQARRNISRHYDLSNELFSLFMDETMTYSCAIFQTPGEEDLKDAQMRKINLLIDKAKIKKEHHILEIGCGWGSLALEAVKRTGCKYTGITLSKKQLEYAEMKVKEAGMQDHIKLIFCDYRQLPKDYKYDRIISCEVLEAVGHEYMEEFFKSCESALAPNGILVIQSSSVADEKYDEYRLSHGFIKEYIFPGGYVPSLSQITSAMAAASRLSIVHLEDIGSHYYYTLRYWRKKFIQNESEILALGFDEKFIRTWDYYFSYCAAGFKSRVLSNYQIVMNRPGDASVSGNDLFSPVKTIY